MLQLIPLLLIVGFVLHVLVLQLGAPMVGAKRPELARTLITCLLAPFFVFAAGLLVGAPLGCLASVLGGWASLAISLLVAIAARAILYAFLLGFNGRQAGLLATASALLGWVLSSAAFFGIVGISGGLELLRAPLQGIGL